MKSCILLLVSILLTACYSYKPALIHSPKFEEGGEVNLGATVGNNLGATVSVSPVKHLAILADYSSGISYENEYTESNSYNQNNIQVYSYEVKDESLQMALGGYWKYDNELSQSFYTGLSKGSIAARSPENSYLSSISSFPEDLEAFQGNYEGFFLQSSLQIQLKENLLSLDAKYNVLRFNTFEYVYRKRSETVFIPSQEEVYRNYFSNKAQHLLQVGATFHQQLDLLSFFAQAQFAIDINELSSKPSYTVDYFMNRPFSIYVGLSLPVHKLWNRQAE